MTLFDVYPLQPLRIVRGEGARVWDDQGHRYLDLYGGHAVISIGHSHPHWVQRIETQLRQLAFYSNSVELPLQAELAETLGRVSGKEHYRLFLCNSGAEANENALKLASFHTGRRKVLAFQRGFHGRTSLAVEATDNPAIVAPVNRSGNVVFAPLNDLVALEQAFVEHELAAVIVEGIQGVGGIRMAEPAFLQRIRSLCTQHQAVFIADSVQCGYGRSGRFFSHDHAGVSADLYTVAKGMGNGFPVAGVLIGPQFEAKHGLLGTTFGGNPLACAAALAVLEVIEQENLIERAAQTGQYLLDELRRLPLLEQLRGAGLMIGFDVPAPQADLRKNLLFQHRIFTGEAKGGVIRLLPSLALSRAEADEFLEHLDQAIATI
ncbi:MAG: aspartate aminotransferase family protein [Saprospiraceae bacterium]|nr:aspartate aminotransferase family protein [Saprospiraceae bacterium]